MFKVEESVVVREWEQLMEEARNMGLTPEEIRTFLQSKETN